MWRCYALSMLFLLLAPVGWAKPALRLAAEAPPSVGEAAEIFQTMAEDWLAQSPISDARREDLRQRYYTADHSERVARATFQGLEQRGVMQDNPFFGRYVALLFATYFQQSKGQDDALSHADPTEEPGLDLGMYQMRKGTARGIWRDVYTDVPYDEKAMFDLETAAPIWVEHLLQQEAECRTQWLVIGPARIRQQCRGLESRGRCQAVWYTTEPGLTVTLGLATLERLVRVRHECPVACRCARVMRATEGIPTKNMGPSNLEDWVDAYRTAFEKVRSCLSRSGCATTVVGVP